MKPSLGISFKIILEISLFQYVVISQCILICCKFIPPRHLTQIFLLVPFFWGAWGGVGVVVGVRVGKQYQTKSKILRAFATIPSIDGVHQCITIFSSFFSIIAWSLWQRHYQLQENHATWPLHEIGDNEKLHTNF